MLTFWESEESIRAFAGDDISVAKYYDFDKDFLIELEPQEFFYADAGIEKSHHLFNTKSGSSENNREVIDAPELRLVFHYKYPKTNSDHA